VTPALQCTAQRSSKSPGLRELPTRFIQPSRQRPQHAQERGERATTAQLGRVRESPTFLPMRHQISCLDSRLLKDGTVSISEGQMLVQRGRVWTGCAHAWAILAFSGTWPQTQMQTSRDIMSKINQVLDHPLRLNMLGTVYTRLSFLSRLGKGWSPSACRAILAVTWL
jgi:hypothetical protein